MSPPNTGTPAELHKFGSVEIRTTADGSTICWNNTSKVFFVCNGGVTATQVASANKDGAAGTASMRTLGTGATQAAAGNDSRLSDSRAPTAHASSHKHGGTDEVATSTAAANAIPKAGSGGRLNITWLASGTPDGTKFVRDDGVLATPPGSGDMVLAGTQTVTGPKTFGSAGAVGKLKIAGNTSGVTILDATAVAGSGTVTLPTAGTLATLAGSETFTNKTLTQPTIGDLTNATHSHQSAAGGGSLDAAAVGSGVFSISRLATGTPDGTKFVRDDGVLATPSGSSSTPSTFAYATTVTLDTNTALDWAQTNTVTGNMALTLSNGADGKAGTIGFKIDGTGGYTLSIAASGRTVKYLWNGTIPNTANYDIELSYEFATINGSAQLIVGAAVKDVAAPVAAHATSHKHGGSDEVATATAAANAIPKAGSGGQLAIGWLASGTPDGTKFVRDDGTLATPTSSYDPNANAKSWLPRGRITTTAQQGSNDAVAVYIGYFPVATTVTKLIARVQTAGTAGTPAWELGLATTPLGPNGADQTVTKTYAYAPTTTDLTTAGIKIETLGASQSVSGHVWVIFRHAYGGSSPILHGVPDYGAGDVLELGATGALTSWSSGTGAVTTGTNILSGPGWVLVQ